MFSYEDAAKAWFFKNQGSGKMQNAKCIAYLISPVPYSLKTK